jgi:hypothetical protein
MYLGITASIVKCSTYLNYIVKMKCFITRKTFECTTQFVTVKLK